MYTDEPIRNMAGARILIAGMGYVGRPLAGRLVAAGAEVIALKRTQAPMPAGVRWHRGDLADPVTMQGLPRQLDGVIIMVSADGFTEDAYRRCYLDGVGNLLRHLEDRVTVARLLFVSSTGVYGQTSGEWVDETAATEPAGFSGRIMLAAEQQVRDSGVPSVVLRFGGIYGPGRDRMLRMVRDGTARRPSTPVWTNRIHRDDGAAAIAHVLGLTDAPPVVNVVDTEPAELGSLLAGLADMMDLPMPPLDPQPVTRPRGGNKRVSSRLLQQTGFVFRYPTWRDGFRAILAESAT